MLKLDRLDTVEDGIDFLSVDVLSLLDYENPYLDIYKDVQARAARECGLCMYRGAPWYAKANIGRNCDFEGLKMLPSFYYDRLQGANLVELANLRQLELCVMRNNDEYWDALEPHILVREKLIQRFRDLRSFTSDEMPHLTDFFSGERKADFILRHLNHQDLRIDSQHLRQDDVRSFAINA